jgi:hypothetical protein
MKRMLFLVLVFICKSSFGQDDSTYLDLGRMRLKKDAVQHIRISARELEKFPFATLSEAINTRLYGMFSNRPAVVFIVDGNLASDINAYSLEDIEDITLVQAAPASLNGISANQHLVLVRTRRHKEGDKGFRASAQSFLVNRKIEQNGFSINEEKSGTNLFHQYTLGTSGQKKGSRYGLHANYLRDVLPEPESPSNEYRKIPNQDRVRLTGYFGTRIGSSHYLDLNLNYAQQAYDFEGIMNGAPGSITRDDHRKERVYNAALQFQSTIGNGFTNHFHASLNRFTTNQEDFSRNNMFGSDYSSFGSQEALSRTILLRDHLAYSKKMGAWEFNPGVTFVKQFLRLKRNQYTRFQNGTSINTSEYNAEGDGEFFMVSPSIGLNYKNSFYFQSGTLVNTNAGKRKVQPYVVTSFDILQHNRTRQTASLRFHGSYATASNYSEMTYALGDVYYSPTYNTSSTISPTPYLLNPSPMPEWYESRPSFQAGTVYRSKNQRISAQYNYESRNYQTIFRFYSPWGTMYDFPGVRDIIHHAGIQAGIVRSGMVSWMTGLNFTTKETHLQIPTNIGFPFPFPGPSQPETWNTWSGGWINRFESGGFLLGAELLYIYHDRAFDNLGNFEKVNFFNLQSLYTGYRIKGKKSDVELYASFRDAIRSKRNTAFTERRFFGIGAKVEL